MGEHYSTSVADIPSACDNNEFGTQSYIDGLVNFIKYSVTPLTIALQGEWGSGKTSLMNTLYNRLCGDKNEFIGININTWEYSMLSTPEETVLKIIEFLVKELATGEKQKTTMEKFSKWAKLGGGMAFRAAKEAAKVVGGATASILIESFIGNGPDDDKSKAEDISLSNLKKSLESAVEDNIKGKNGKTGVLIFVDDLDRLNPPVAVEILELLKNIFCLKGCIFILAIDYEVVVKGLEPKFGKLTDKNEREFRSFFDKIIQVPFSLPVNNYQPQSFLVNNLRDINYINDGDLNNIDYLREKFSEIVNKTVGKNPRSIIRLINSLSLINCISRINDTGEKRAQLISPESLSGKIINFAVIAVQISYPKIYNLLVYQPNYKEWNWETARRFKALVPNFVENSSNENSIWENVLTSICETDPYLKTRESDIKDIIELISVEIAAGVESTSNAESEDLGIILSEFLNLSSVTGVGGLKEKSEINYSQIISKIQSNVIKNISKTHKDWKFRPVKRITNRGGGFNLYPLNKELQSRLEPRQLNNNRVTIRLTIPLLITANEYPNILNILNAGYQKALYNESLSKLISDFDSSIKPLLGKEWFKGWTLRDRFEKQWHNNGQWRDKTRILFDTTFDFTVPFVSGFEQPEVIAAITTIHEAVWNLHIMAKNLI